jgi:anti-sigma-K factor RskA
MSKSHSGDDQLLALLYAAGQLDGKQAAAFERRLADDQAVRDALCTAVRLTWATEGRTPAMPDPAYRERVRRRLLAGKAKPSNDRPGLRVRTAAWTIAGAAAAALLLVAIGFSPRDQANPTDQAAAASSSEEVAAMPVTPDPLADDDDCLPDLMGGTHLAKAVEESRRKVRADEHRIARMEERPSRLRSAPIYRQ